MEIFNKCCAVIVIKNEKILLGLREDGQGWSMAGGKVEKNEDYEDAAKRELKEEFNLHANSLECLGTITSVAYVRGVKRIVRPTVFLCRNFEGNEKPQLSEMKMLQWMNLDEISNVNLFEPTKEIFSKIKWKKSLTF